MSSSKLCVDDGVGDRTKRCLYSSSSLLRFPKALYMTVLAAMAALAPTFVAIVRIVRVILMG